MNIGFTIRYNYFIRLLAIAFLLTAGSSVLMSQESVFDTPLTLRMNSVKISTVLKAVTREISYEFTYDTDLVKPDSIVSVTAEDNTLRELLDQIFFERNLLYATIGNHIIIYREPVREENVAETENEEQIFLASGTVIEKGSGSPLPYATLGIYRKGKGTVSNFDGRFSFKVTREELKDSLRISYLGFKNLILPVNVLIGENYTIELERDFVSIPEVIIRTRDPADLIRNVKKNIPDNYGSSPALLTAFYRESVSRRTKLQEYSEAVLNIYKSAYTKSILTDQIKLYKCRKLVNTDESDTLVIKLKAGLNATLMLDGIRNIFDFIDDPNIPDYNYRMVDIVSFDDEAAFVVEFSQKEYITDMALFKGYIYINTENYGVHSAEFEINPDYIGIVDDQFVPQAARGYNVKVKKAKYKVDYRLLNGRYFLNHVRGDLEFFVRKKRTLFGNPYNVFFELATTAIDTVNVTRFERNETVPTNSVFSEIKNQYDPYFWGADNFLKPEENIQEAIRKINSRLEKFEQQ